MIHALKRLLFRLAVTLAILAGVAGAAVLLLPLRVTIDSVATQPTTPLPEALSVAMRYGLMQDGTPARIRLQAARLIVLRDGPRNSVMRVIEPLFLTARLAVFTNAAQSERLVAQFYLPRCWRKAHDDLTVPEALYLAARMAAPSRAEQTFIRDGMARIAKRALAADEELAAAFLAAAAGPLPVCE